MAVIGPGTIALSMSIGSGEWLMGPAVASQYGPALLWITTVAVFFQVIFNQECARYVMYTGETAYAGFMRYSPGADLLGCGLYPHRAFSGPAGRDGRPLRHRPSLPPFSAIFQEPADRGTMMAWGYVSFAACFVVLLFGGTVERGLEKISTFIVIWIAVFLLAFNLYLRPRRDLVEVRSRGFFNSGYFPKGADWVLLGGFAAYSGAGGLGNVWTASWIRDKGFGMGSIVGAIPSAGRRKRDRPFQNRKHLRPRQREQHVGLEDLVEISPHGPGGSMGGRVHRRYVPLRSPGRRDYPRRDETDWNGSRGLPGRIHGQILDALCGFFPSSPGSGFSGAPSLRSWTGSSGP